jgi:hypothetical protein
LQLRNASYGEEKRKTLGSIANDALRTEAVFRRRPAGAMQARDYGATFCLGGRSETRLSWLRPFEKDSKNWSQL